MRLREVVILSTTLAMGLFSSIYVLINYLQYLSGAPASCQINNWLSCEKTLGTEASVFMGIPLPILGVVYFILLLLFFGLVRFNRKAFFSKLSYLHLGGGLVAIYLLGFQILHFRSICLGCFFVNITLMGLAAFSLRHIEWKKMSSLLFNSLFLVSWILSSYLASPSLMARGQAYLIETEEEDNLPVPSLNFLHNEVVYGTGRKKIQLSMVLDPRCPHCADHFNQLLKVSGQLDQTVHLTIWWLPADQACYPEGGLEGHEHGCDLARLFLCAKKQSADLIKKNFERQALGSLELKPGIERIWQTESLTTLDWQCFESDSMKKNFKTNVSDIFDQGFDSTPVTWIGNKMIEGALNEKSWTLKLLSISPF